MISIDYHEIPEYLHSSKFYEGVDKDDHSAITIPQECFKKNISIGDVSEFENLLHTIRFWMIGDPHLNVLTFLLSNEVPSYLVEDCREFYSFGASYFILKNLPSDERVEFAIHCSISLAIVQKLHSLGSGLPKNMCALATKKNRLDLLRYAFSQQCEWGNTAKIATTRGNVDCLHFAHANGCSLDSELVQIAAEKGHLACLQFLHRTTTLRLTSCVSAAKHGHLDCLQYLHEEGIPWNANTTEWAAKQGHLHCLIYAHQHGCPLTDKITQWACGRGDLACLHYAVSRGCLVTDKACYIAANNGHLSCLQYAHRMGGQWSERVSRAAAREGHLHCLRYLHESGFPWNEDTLFNALWEDHPQCALYLLRHGCPSLHHKRLLAIYILFFLLWPYLLQRQCTAVHAEAYSIHSMDRAQTLLHTLGIQFWLAQEVLCMYHTKLKKRYPAFPTGAM